MRPAMTQQQAKHRKATSDAMKRMTKRCKKCDRRQIKAATYLHDGEHFIGTVWECRYCGHVHERNVVRR